MRYRRAMVVLASAGNNDVEVIARLVQTSPDRVREMIHRFNEMGMASLDPQWAGGRPRRITIDEEDFIVAMAKARPEKAGRPFSHWSICKLGGYLGDNAVREVVIGKERLRQILERHEVTFQDHQDVEAVQRRVQGSEVGSYRGGLRAFLGSGVRVRRVRAVGDPPDRWVLLGGEEEAAAVAGELSQALWGGAVPRLLLGGRGPLVGCRARQEGDRQELGGDQVVSGGARPDGEMIYVILDNLSAQKGTKIKAWCARNNVELCFTPTYSSWANPIECHFGPLRDFVLNNSDHPNHTVLTKRLHAYLHWRKRARGRTCVARTSAP